MDSTTAAAFAVPSIRASGREVAAYCWRLERFKEAGIDVNRPSAMTAVKKEHASILVAITEDGQIWIDKRVVDPRAVRANIERLHAENPQGSVVIQADKDSRNEILVQVMDAVRIRSFGQDGGVADRELFPRISLGEAPSAARSSRSAP